MVKVRKSLVGLVFDRLTVIRQDEDYVNPKGVHFVQYYCQCKCGNFKTIKADRLKEGGAKSCGCLQKERAIESNSKENDYEIQEDYVIMYTSNDNCFLVDLEDFERVRKHCWCDAGEGYFVCRTNQKNIQLHDFIMNCPKGKMVDHIGGIPSRFDNRKTNLRIATALENSRNVNRSHWGKTGITGVRKYYNKWEARITVNYKGIHLGYFDTIEEATRVRKEAENKYFGEFSYDNSQKQYVENIA